MNIKCPACRKQHDTHTSELHHCTRCKCDLSTLILIAQATEQRTRKAIDALTRNQWDTALEHAIQSWKLRHTPQSASVAYLASIALGDVANAARWSHSITIEWDHE